MKVFVKFVVGLSGPNSFTGAKKCTVEDLLTKIFSALLVLYILCSAATRK